MRPAARWSLGDDPEVPPTPVALSSRTVPRRESGGAMNSSTPSRHVPQLTPRTYRKNFGEFIGVGPNGNLWVEECDVKELADRFGTPLFIISESQFRYTYRAFRDAFRRHYPD